MGQVLVQYDFILIEHLDGPEGQNAGEKYNKILASTQEPKYYASSSQ